MADPLSIAASIAGLVGLADIVFARLVKFGRSVKNAEEEIRHLAQEINLLGGALNSLERLAQVLKDDAFDTNLRMHNIDDCRETLKEMNKKLEKLEATSSLMKQKLMWPFTKDRVKEWLDDLSKHKENINLALSANSLDAMLRVLSQESHHATQILAEIKETRKITSRIHQDSERLKVLNFFLKYNPQKNYDMSIRLRQSGTGIWLQKLQDFQHWLSEPGSKLWLKGIPGAGKTVLAGSIIESALKRSIEAIPSAFFFCDYKEADTHTIENILGALVYQLSIQKEDAYTMLERYYNELHPINGLPKQPTRKALQRLLRRILELFDHTYLVVDGLDECGKSTDEVVECLFDISEDADNVSIALLSRDEDEIRSRLEGSFTPIEIAAHKEDITEYVTAEIQERIRSRRLRISNLHLKGEILQGLIDGAKGMFRWIACQLDHLGECDSDQQCRDALKSLPPTLDETYERILRRVPKSKQSLTELALNCIAHASPKLNLHQLQEILSVPEPGVSLDAGSVIREESITRYCSSLIRKSTDGLSLEFSHFSVLEFLEKAPSQHPGFEWIRVSKSRAYALLAVQCLKFIQLQNFYQPKIELHTEVDEIDSRNQLHPLYSHASTRWPEYARGEWENETVFDLAVSLFHPSKTCYFTSWAIHLARGTGPGPKGSVEKTVSLFINPDFTPLHMAAALSLPRICCFLMKHGVRVNLESPMGRPLQCAVQSLPVGYSLWATGSLKSNGVLVFQDNQQDRIATVDTIRCLCREGAPLNLQCCNPFSGMSLVQLSLDAFGRSHTFRVTMALIREGARLEETDSLIVQQHIEDLDLQEYEDEVRAFLEFLDSCSDQSTAHHRMSAVLWKFAVACNLKFTKDPTIIDTKLSLTNDELERHAVGAVTVANTQVLEKMLCDPRLKVASVVDADGDSLLHLALLSCRGAEITALHVEIVKKLLDAGCDVRMTNRKGIDPLQSWDWSTDDMENPPTSKLELFDEVAHLLTDHGARCDLQDTEKRTALHLHISEPFRLRALLKYQPTESVKKAMETTDNNGYTPLTLCLWKMLTRSASILLAPQTTITAKMTESPIAALSLAVRAGDEKTFDALLQSGINFSFQDTETLLHHLGPKTSSHFVRRLKALYPESSGHRFNNHTPLESYLICCLETSGVRDISDSIIDELAILDTSESEVSKAMTWECFMSRILSSTLHLPRSWTGIREDLAEKDDRQVISENVSTNLIRLGYLKSFESCFGKSAIIPLMQPFSTLTELSKPWSRLKDLVSEVLRQTQHWDSLREFPGIILLLKVAAHSYNFRIVKLLLQKEVSVHQRVDGLSALESFVKTPRLDGLMHTCSAKSEDTDDEENYCAKRMLDLLLRHCDKPRINEIIPDGSGLALIHLPNAWGAEWVIEKIVDHGANPNLRVDKHPSTPAAVYQFFKHRCCSGYVKTILKKGADPTLTDDFGFDTALIAAMCRAVPVLTEIYDDIKQGAKKDWHDKMDWCKKCRLSVPLENMSLICTGVTALHLGALCQSTDVLCFYNNHKLMEDLEVRSDEGFTSLHFAASQGSVSNIKYLSALGCDIDARGKDGSSPLHLAARSNKIEACRVLIKAGCRSFEDSVGMTPLLYAHQASNEELANLLDTVKSGSSVTHVEIERRRKRSLALSFKIAIEKDDLTMCKYLHTKECDLATYLNDFASGSLLVQALKQKRIAIVEWMLQQRVSMTSAVSGSKPVELAIHLVLKDAELVDVLPASLENYTKNGGRLLGETPNLVSTAVRNRNIKGLGVLIQYVKDNQNYCGKLWSIHPDRVIPFLVNEAEMSTGLTPLHVAADCGALGAVQVLLEFGADINAESKWLDTPLFHAITPFNNPDEAVALHLIQGGADLERRNVWYETPAITAAKFGRKQTLMALVNADVDINASNNNLQSPAHFAAQMGNVVAFADLMHRGVDPYRVDIFGFSAFHHAIEDSKSVSFLLNSNFSLEDSVCCPWHLHFGFQAAWLTTAYPLFRKRYGLQALQKFANLVPSGSQAPLCKGARLGAVLFMENLLELGAPIDLEGCPSGSALMAACEFGRKESVEYLVRRGAVLSYNGVNGFRSAIKSAKGNKKILRWLLVDRFIDQQKLTDGCDGIPHDETNRGPFSWGGPIQAELVISGRMERLCHQSSREYWSYLMKEKIRWRGRILPPNTRRRTVSHSNIVPQEIVRVHPQGYNSNGHEEAWFSKKVPKIQSDGRCWYMSYIP